MKGSEVEVNFIDAVYRKAVRVTGLAQFIVKSDANPELLSLFFSGWPNLTSILCGFVKIHISEARLIVSPAYDRGATAEELRGKNLRELNAL
ncbi:MAG: hypothetical protein CBB68_00510 [Rhodospirillaceae bacterium TMED8]|nr:hypothetical protein [Magnetovibrio sp.]OUT53367.1 MAG: hypothetical protein CBB68_00510 [Rhodospirillaceae bacterium TMED8]